jgi:hypothetical protein
MKNLNKINIGFLLMILCISCDSFVEVNQPNAQLTSEAVFQDFTTANAAMLEVYAKMRDGSFISGASIGSGITLGFYADEMIRYGNDDNNTSMVFNNTLLPSTSTVLQNWNRSYQQIYGVNAVIEGCENSTQIAEINKNQLIGEAKFLRALIHFYLVNLYDGVPYITTTDYEINRSVQRLSVQEVYQKITTDLNDAIVLLPEEDFSFERVRANKYVALTLLARVNLYQEKWAEAAEAASEVINNPTYIWENDLSKTFLKNSTATIWQFSPRLSGQNTAEGSAHIFNSGPPPVRSLSANIVNAFDMQDARRSEWIRTISNGNNEWYHAFKYKQNNATGESVEYSIIFRLSELYLIRSEARARQGELVGALSDLNLIRNTAGLPNSVAANQNDIINAILDERKWELFTEHGHRFFDLKRMGKLDEVLSPIKMGWNTSDRLWPIPEVELLSNPNLTQNPGY